MKYTHNRYDKAAIFEQKSIRMLGILLVVDLVAVGLFLAIRSIDNTWYTLFCINSKEECIPAVLAIFAMRTCLLAMFIDALLAIMLFIIVKLKKISIKPYVWKLLVVCALGVIATILLLWIYGS